MEKSLDEIQREVDQYISQFKEGYFSPLAMLARMSEEVGEALPEKSIIPLARNRKKRMRPTIRLSWNWETFCSSRSALQTRLVLI